ncbi:NO-inducible flavohemoprotein [Hahella ganghwensis]|uniref:NO-inducible flavohemoprotein n=1 Tax=Hahella ganghwensis TaxID=286420 RepID=UPI00036E5B2D|nr:NO-inducible flavohemoprotein [Hahella ganghwensis]
MPSGIPLSQQQIQVIQQTIPLLESAGPAITEHFYQRMFTHNPELQNVFNMSHQRSGKQQFALFSAIASYAKHLDDLSSLTSMVERIANKHSSLGILPEHYPIVGHHLIETLRELAADAFTDEVEAAWSAGYEFLANIFIDKEETIYFTNAEKNGGWRGTRKFRLVEKRIESELVKSLVFEPLDGGTVSDYKPGQYIGIKLSIPGHEFEEIRQYSLSDKFNEDCYRISVKREVVGTPGLVSNFLHDGLRLNDEVELYPPAGDFFYQERQSPVVLISAGVGITPMMAIAESLAQKNSQHKVCFLHACENIEQHSFRKRISQLKETLSLTHHTWYRNDHSDEDNVHHGFMDLAQIEQELPLNDGDFYLCGPVPFMQFAKQQLVTLGVDSSRIHYEVFGPHEAF